MPTKHEHNQQPRQNNSQMVKAHHNHKNSRRNSTSRASKRLHARPRSIGCTCKTKQMDDKKERMTPEAKATTRKRMAAEKIEALRIGKMKNVFISKNMGKMKDVKEGK